MKKPTRNQAGGALSRLRRDTTLRKRILLHAGIIGAAFATAALTFLIVMDAVVMPIYQQAGMRIVLPELVGRKLDDALSVAMVSDYSVVVDSLEFTDRYPAGIISSQIPAAGTIIKPGRRVRVRLSRGAHPIDVPNIVGLSAPNARLVIRTANLQINEGGFVPSDTYLQGIVARQAPPAGTQVTEQARVTIYISNGRREPDTIMPDLLNLSYSSALDSLRAHGFDFGRLKLQREERGDLLPDTVLDQFPDPGTPAKTTEEVVLIVSTRPEGANR